MPQKAWLYLGCSLLGIAPACDSHDSGADSLTPPTDGGSEVMEDPGKEVQLSVNAVAFDELAAQVSAARAIDRTAFDAQQTLFFVFVVYCFRSIKNKQ